jgi:hypothetical protein
MKKIVRVVAGSLWALPFMAFAANSVNTKYLESIVTKSRELMGNLVIALVSLAVVWFIWNVIQYTIAEDEEKKKKAKSQMIWGIVAIAVIVSIWGLVSILQGIFGIDTTSSPDEVGRLVPLQ